MSWSWPVQQLLLSGTSDLTAPRLRQAASSTKRNCGSQWAKSRQKRSKRKLRIFTRHLSDSNTRSRRNWLCSAKIDEKVAGQRVNHSAKVPCWTKIWWVIYSMFRYWWGRFPRRAVLTSSRAACHPSLSGTCLAGKGHRAGAAGPRFPGWLLQPAEWTGPQASGQGVLLGPNFLGSHTSQQRLLNHFLITPPYRCICIWCSANSRYVQVGRQYHDLDISEQHRLNFFK
ncbi:hypothetical protein HDK64DRAFT_4226 [Phyllosticta capitalensis]